MAGDWIKIVDELPDKPEVRRIARALSCNANTVTGAMVRFWIWAKQHTKTGTIECCDEATVDTESQQPGLAKAATDAKWLAFEGEGLDRKCLIINWDRHNSPAATKRAVDSDRVKRWRNSFVTPDVTERVTQTPSQTKRCAVEEEVEGSFLSSSSGSVSSSALRWSRDAGFVGITAKDRAGWATAYPAVDVDRQLAAMHEWLVSNPEKSVKSKWRRFITNWLARSQERGGDHHVTNRSNGLTASRQPAHRERRRANEYADSGDIPFAQPGDTRDRPAAQGQVPTAAHRTQ